jgi:hypothetical protein
VSSVQRDHKRVEGLASSFAETRKASRALGGKKQERFQWSDPLSWFDWSGGEGTAPVRGSPFDGLPATEPLTTGGTNRAKGRKRASAAGVALRAGLP